MQLGEREGRALNKGESPRIRRRRGRSRIVFLGKGGGNSYDDYGLPAGVVAPKYPLKDREIGRVKQFG